MADQLADALDAVGQRPRPDLVPAHLSMDERCARLRESLRQEPLDNVTAGPLHALTVDRDGRDVWIICHTRPRAMEWLFDTARHESRAKQLRRLLRC